MRFGKKGTNQMEFNLEKITNSQLWVLADFMGCRDQIYKSPENLRRTWLADACRERPDRAKIAIDIIVNKQMPQSKPGGMPESKPVDNDQEITKKLVNVLNGYSKSLEDLSSIRLDATLAKAKKIFAAAAAEALREAEEKVRPIEIRQSAKKTKKLAGVLPDEFERLLQLASQRIPIMLVGPAGCGKTYLAGKLADALQLPYSDQSCSEGMSESVFNGLLLPIGKQGAFQHVASPFMDRYENGGVMLLDEIDAGDANLFTYVNKAIANDSYTVAQRFVKPQVKKSPDFVLIAAANTFGHGSDAMYCGRNQLDAATLDRFKVGLVCLDYSEKVERNLAHPELCDWAWKIRAKIREHKLRRVMSTRTIEHLEKVSNVYQWDKKDWEQAYFTGWPENERRLVA